ncbi:hypothetical protein EDB84DRAFT_1618797 [Lactarius hengduanensis]|nr:hypothetical protein EDB84DRAFT_1618797 [Lactarius hengduanensis]
MHLVLAAQIAAAGGEFGRPVLGVGAGLSIFAEHIGGNGPRGGSGRSRGRSPVWVAAVPVAAQGTVLRTLRLHKDTPNFEVMMWKEMMIMDEQALEAQDVAELAAQEDAQDVRGRPQNGVHRGPHRVSPSAGGTSLDSGRLDWRWRWADLHMIAPLEIQRKNGCCCELKRSITLSPSLCLVGHLSTCGVSELVISI